MKPSASTNLNSLWAEWVVEELVRQSVTTFYICPGSRSTPLTLAAARHAKTRTSICYDERGAGYRALGYARATQQPAVVITTSGTAVANLHPAVVEAAQDGIPLLLLTADRPPELTDTGANQAIPQTSFFAQHVRWQFELPCPSADVDPAFVLTTVDQAVHRSRDLHAGPVHLNVRIREPFLGSTSRAPDCDTSGLADWSQGSSPWTHYSASRITIAGADLERVVTLINRTDRGMLLVGRLGSDAQREAVRALIRTLGWPVYADLASGLRLAEVGTHIMRYFDQSSLSEAFNARCRPRTLLHLGGRVTSKRVPLFFQQNRPEQTILVKEDPSRQDPIHGATHALHCDIEWFAQTLCRRYEGGDHSAFRGFYLERAERVDNIIAETIGEEEEITEPFVARRMTELIPNNHSLFVANSMPIRDVDIYGVHQRRGVRVGVNRGASGIDGTIATALGFAEGCGTPTTLLLGDIAFIHDMSSLAQVSGCRFPLIIIVINNRGGGIFRFLPVSQEKDVFDAFFVTPHSFSLAGLGEPFHLDTYRVGTKAQFDQAYGAALQAGRSALIEVSVDGQKSFQFRKGLKAAILETLK